MVSKFFRGIFNTAVIGIMSLLVSSAFTMTAFAASPGDVGAWANTTVLPQSLSFTNAVTYNGYVFVIGGYNGTDKNTVYSAPLNSDGTVGTWATTTPLPQILAYSTSVVYNGYLYVLGGYSDSGDDTLDTVYSAPLDLNGTVGAWATSVNTLPQTINSATSIAYNGYIYVMGGYNSGRLDTVYSAAVNNGTVGVWATSANTLPLALQNSSAITYNGYAYVIGGSSNSGLSDAVYSAPLGVSGTIGTWATSPNTLPQGLRYASAITYNGYAYNIAGTSVSGYLNNVYYAQLTGYLPPSSSSQPTSASSGSSVTVDVLAGVSGNPDPSTLEIITGPVHGVATISGSNITYTATSGYVGSDSLVYEVCSLNDASLCTQSTLSFTVTAAAVATVAAPNTGLEPTNYMLAAITLVAGIGLILVARRRYL